MEGIGDEDIISKNNSRLHVITQFARVDEAHLKLVTKLQAQWVASQHEALDQRFVAILKAPS